MQEAVVQREIQRIFIRDKHVWWITYVLITETFISHIESYNHILLGNPDRSTHHKCINYHDAAWIFILLTCILQSSIRKENPEEVLMYGILGG